MKRIYLVILGVVLVSATAFAQKGNNQIGVGADVAFPTGDFGEAFKTGFGGYAKGLYGIGTAGQITFTTGYSSFKAKGSDEDFKITTSVIPLLAGYRHNFNGFFVEPQVGYGIYGIKIKGGGEFDGKDSEGAFTWAASVGYVFNKQVEVSARYQSGHKDGGSMSVFGVRLGYNFSFGGNK